MILSPRGAAFIGREEGYRADVYNDSEGFCTVGIGHLLHYSSCTPADHAKWDGMTLAQAEHLLASDNGPNLQAIQHWIHVPLAQHQVDALCSFLVNCGPGAISGGVQRAVNRGQDPTLALEAWAHPEVLLGRRKREARLYMTGDYGDGQGPHVPPHDVEKPPAKLPAWFWPWAEWRLGRGRFKGHAHDPARRHLTKAPPKVPPWAFRQLDKFVKGEPIR